MLLVTYAKIVFERLLICCDIESKCESGPADVFFLNIAISGLKIRPYNLVQPTQKEFIEPNYQKKNPKKNQVVQLVVFKRGL